MSDTAQLRWGCIGTGNIAMAMAQQLSRLPFMTLEALSSGSGKPLDEVDVKRAEFGYNRALALEAMLADPSVDIVYVASASSAHAAHCLEALRAGKPVLCEKPLTLSAIDAECIFAEATRHNILLVDGTFSACLPAITFIQEHLSTVGKIHRVELNKKIRMKIMEGSPIINVRELGGGLFDGCGSYTVHMLCIIFGASAVASLRSEDIVVVSTPSPGGEVDWDTTVTIRLCGAIAVLTHRAADEARKSVIEGENGSLEFTLPRLEEVILNGESHKMPYAIGAPFGDLPAHEPGAPVGVHAGLGLQALVVRDALVSGVQGPGAPHLTLDVMRAITHAMDLVRRRIPTHMHFVQEDLEQ